MHLGHVLTKMALGFARVAARLVGLPRAVTVHSAFATLMALAVLPTTTRIRR